MNTGTEAGLIDRPAAAQRLGIVPGTLANWQSSHFRKVPHVKIGRRVMYRIQDLDRWIEAQVVNPIED